MKSFFKYIMFIVTPLVVLYGCSMEPEYKKHEISPYISNFDLRKMYRGSDVTLTVDGMRGATMVRGQVVSDHSGNNLPAGLIFIQNLRSVGAIDSLRGIAINVGTAASNYVPGDSLHIDVNGGVLKRVDGILQIAGVDGSKINKVASNVDVWISQVSTADIAKNPEAFESRLVSIFNSNYEPNIGIEKLAGVKTFSDGIGEFRSKVEATSILKDEFLPYSANIKGIIIRDAGDNLNIHPRVKSDFIPTSITVDPTIPLGPTPVVISGFSTDVLSTDGNYEYAQFLATQDLDFRQTPFAVIFSRNGGGLEPYPDAAPKEGWATGGNRTYKFNITRGTVAKGTFFYVGGHKLISGGNSTSIASANWVANKLYVTEDGDDGMGNANSGMMPNSGHPAGIGVFVGTNVTPTSVPVDAVFFGSSTSTQNTFKAADAVAGTPAYGYLIPNNDHYSITSGQKFVKQGTNTFHHTYNSGNADYPQGTFIKLNGQYRISNNSWPTKRTQVRVRLTNSSVLSEIETGTGILQILP